jgi:hypothetical protein
MAIMLGIADGAVAPPPSDGMDAVLEGQVQDVARHLMSDPAVLAVVLLGSVARGEAAFGEVGGRRELFSDLELLAVTSHRLPIARRSRLANQVEQMAAHFGNTNPLFHTEVLFRERSRLRAMPPFVFTYELASNGRTIAGQELRGEIRTVNLGNLDRRNTHEILMKRLWALAEALPTEWVGGQPLRPVQERALDIALGRQPLDLTTVLLPEVGILLPTYHERVACWLNSPAQPFRSAIDAALGRDSGVYLQTCLDARARGRLEPDLRSAYRDALAVLVAALGWLLGVSPESVPAATGSHSRALFHERPVTRGEWVALLRQTVALARQISPAWAWRWSRAPRKGKLAAGLIHLHWALIAHQSGDVDRAARALAEARAAVASSDSSGVTVPADADFVRQWLATRAVLGHLFWRTVRLGDPAARVRLDRAIGLPGGSG